MWIAALALSAGAGAFVAAHTNPFPPGVEDPGVQHSVSVSPSEGPSPSQTPATRLQVELTIASRHELHVGGTCRSGWTVVLTVREAEDASATAQGRATLHGPSGCPFATAQIQARRIDLTGEGHVQDGTLFLAMHMAGALRPAGSTDLGGFVETLTQLRLRLPVGGPVTALAPVTTPDGDLGRYVSEGNGSVTCVRGC